MPKLSQLPEGGKTTEGKDCGECIYMGQKQAGTKFDRSSANWNSDWESWESQPELYRAVQLPTAVPFY